MKGFKTVLKTWLAQGIQSSACWYHCLVTWVQNRYPSLLSWWSRMCHSRKEASLAEWRQGCLSTCLCWVSGCGPVHLLLLTEECPTRASFCSNCWTQMARGLVWVRASLEWTLSNSALHWHPLQPRLICLFPRRAKILSWESYPFSWSWFWIWLLFGFYSTRVICSFQLYLVCMWSFSPQL